MGLRPVKKSAPPHSLPQIWKLYNCLARISTSVTPTVSTVISSVAGHINRSPKDLMISEPLITGHCTDSASITLVKLASLSTYAEAKLEVTFVGLKRQGSSYFAPMLWPNYPSIDYPCWNHSSQTAVYNLMTGNISIVPEILNVVFCNYLCLLPELCFYFLDLPLVM